MNILFKPHGAVLEVLNGETPSREQFTEEKLKARKSRIIINQEIACCHEGMPFV